MNEPRNIVGSESGLGLTMLQRRHQRCLFLLALVAVYGSVSTVATSCSYKPHDCTSEDCIRRWQCDRGECGKEAGCVCPPCYGGPTCADYEDRYPPTFRMDQDTLSILPSQQGQVVYKMMAEDKDLITVCPLTLPGQSPDQCPCGVMKYSLVALSPPESQIFVLDPDTGDLVITAETQELVAPGDTYLLQITVMSDKQPGSTVQFARMNLTVIVEDEDLFDEENEEQIGYEHQDGDETLSKLPGGGVYNVEPMPGDLVQQAQSGVGAKDRQKRSSSGTGAGASEMTLTAVGTDPTELYPGQSVSYDLNIILPTLTGGTTMDLLVEIFVMDAVTGITPFALCAVEIVTVGSAIQDSAGAAFDKTTVVIDVRENELISGVNDRVILDFGTLQNTAADDGGADKSDSTIHITFGASLILNDDYTNSTAIVTAGAEYDSENYVWVSQASYTYDMNPGYSYPSQITIDGPDTAVEWGGATFLVDAIISDPFGVFTFEVYTPLGDHNLFTVSNIEIVSIGTNLQCTGVPVPEYEYFYSVDRMTYHRGIATFDVIMTGLEYPNLVNELSDMENKIEIAFAVFFVEAKAGDIISVGAGLSVGTTTLWTAIANVTIDPGTTTPVAGSATYGTATEIGTDRSVAQYGTLTWGVPIEVPNGANAAVSCTATAGDHFVSVVWGRAGANIALRPNLTDGITLDPASGATAWEFNINSTGQVTGDTAADTAILEVSVTYLTGSVDDVTVTCDGTAITLSGGSSGPEGTVDMSGTAEPVNTLDNVWYKGSQQALVAKLTFPGGGSPYSKMEIQTSGDFDITAFGAEVCKVEIMKAGKGVPGIAGQMDYLNSQFLLEKIQPSSIYDDGANLTVGAVSGANRGAAGTDADYEVVIRMTYVLPKDQTTITATTYNMSLGILFNTDLIWTGWTDFTTDTGVPTSVEVPVVEVIPPEIPVQEIGRPTMVMVKLKTKPGSVDEYKVEAISTDTETLAICRIIFIAVGSSYPCLDPDPYGKELLNPAQPNTIIHDPDEWALKATADLGVLRNVGYQEYYADTIADSDSIVMGVLVRGILETTSVDLTVNTYYGGTAIASTVSLEIASPLTHALSVTEATWVPRDGTADAYEGVMKLIDLVLTFPDGYGQPVVITIENAAPTDMNLCFVAVAAAGKNMPCVIPHVVEVLVTETDALQSHAVQLLETCQYDVVPGAVEENTVTLRMGVQFTKTGTTGTLTAEILENGVASAVQPTPYAITLSGTAFDPTSINTTTEGFSVELSVNETEVVFPGSSMFYGINIILPPDATGKVEIGAMAPTDGGRAYATIHGFRWANESGKNVACMMDPETGYYDVQLLQNSSLGDPMIHTSQTDTMVIDIGYLTNTGVSYMQKMPVEPDDNVVGLEIEIMMADHINATTGSIIPISIAVKFGDVIYVVTKNLEIVRDAALDLMVLRSEVNFTEPEPDPLFHRTTKKQIPMTIRMSHVMNESRQEANDAIVRVLLPRPVQFVEADDIESCNITYNFTNNHYLDFSISNLFFTDYLEINATVTVDPLDDMVKGLGVINAAALVRLVCTTFTEQTAVKYCGTTTILPFQIDGSECYEPLGLNTMDPCQFSASTAIKAASGPEFSGLTGSGWSPAVRTGPGWDHHITIDFLKKTRVTKITFASASGGKVPVEVKVQYSHNGITFTSPCSDVLPVVGNAVELPSPCKFEARYGRLIIVDTNPDDTAFVVNFEWHGCAIDTLDDTCNSQPTTFTDSPGWRQIALDDTNGVFYFCDYSPKKKKNVCFSTTDGATWNALPAYIGSIVGFDAATQLFYARDAKGVATVSSSDGINWMVVDQTVADALTVTALDVSGEPRSTFASQTLGDYSAEFDGIEMAGALVAKWESCCS